MRWTTRTSRACWKGVAFLADSGASPAGRRILELTDAQFGLLYPHYLSPCAVLHGGEVLDCSARHGKCARLPAGIAIETLKLRTARNCATARPRPSRYGRTRVENVRLSGQPIAGSRQSIRRRRNRWWLRITLKCASPEATFAQLGGRPPRFFRRGLYRSGRSRSTSCQVPTPSRSAYADNAAVIRAGHRIRQARLSRSASRPTRLCCHGRHGFSGFRLLTEYFAFPGEVPVLRPRTHGRRHHGVRWQPVGGLRLPDRPLTELERTGWPTTLARLHAAGQPVSATLRAGTNHQSTEASHRTGRPRRPRAGEIWSGYAVDARHCPTARSVHGVHSTGSQRAIRSQAFQAAFTMWLDVGALARRALKCSSHRMTRTSIRQASRCRSVWSMRCASTETCPASCSGAPSSPSPGRGAAIAGRMPTAATSAFCSPVRESGFWRLVSHLSLGHLLGHRRSCRRAEGGALRSARPAETRAAIEALTGVTAGPGTARAPGRRLAVAWTSPSNLTPRAWQAAGLNCSPRCWSTSLRCTAPSTASRAPASPCADAPHRRCLAGPQRTPRARMRRRSALGALGSEPRRFRFDAAGGACADQSATGSDPADGMISCAPGADLSVGRRHRGPPAGR